MSKQRQKGTSSRSSHFSGLIAEGRFIEFAATNEWPIYRGVDGHEPCDYVIDMGGELVRVEVKGCWQIYNYPSQGKGLYYFTVTKIQTKKFDWIFVVTPQGHYWVPSGVCPTSLSIAVRGTTSRSKWEAYRIVDGPQDQEGGRPYVEATI